MHRSEPDGLATAKDRLNYADAKMKLSSGAYVEALAELLPLKSAFAGDPLYLADLCLAHEANSQLEDAIQVHEKLNEMGCESLERLNRMANCYIWANRPENALATAERILSAAYYDIPARLIKIDALITLNRKEEALKLAETLVHYDLYNGEEKALQPDWFYVRLSQSFRALGFHEKAAEIELIPTSHMENLIGHLVMFAGVDESVAREAIGHLLVFLQMRNSGGPADELIAKLPGAEDAIEIAKAARGRGVLGSFVADVGGAMGGATGDSLALAAKLLGLGMSQEQLQRFAKQFFLFAERTIGKEKTRQMTDPIPGLAGFLWPAR